METEDGVDDLERFGYTESADLDELRYTGRMHTRGGDTRSARTDQV